ncbi:hypothetical protein ACFXJ8_29675 [Nonomuraea sp. NPDC059194]|uniref:hypothetical protein n=1 Tax=Nonomuraea sp. NPDC059194 TaxID=3346764 RepID=UPI0036ABF3E3
MYGTFAFVLLAQLLSGGFTSGPAPLRAAWPTAEPTGDGGAPTGTWQLEFADGRRKSLSVARATSSPWAAAPVAISGDGLHLAYVRAGDRRVVVASLVGGADFVGPSGEHVRAMWLSEDGGRLLVDHHDERLGDGRRAQDLPDLLVEVGSGRTVSMPAGGEPAGFSADGDEVLSRRVLTGGAIQLTAHRTDGTAASWIPPQDVALTDLALSADGTTLVTLDEGRLRRYDLASGRWLGGGASLDPSAYGMAWRAGVLTAKTGARDASNGWNAKVLAVDPAAGATRELDGYRLPEGATAVQR